MPLSDHPVRASIAVTDIRRASRFYEDRLGLPLLRSGPSAAIDDGGRCYGSGGDDPALVVFESATAGATMATMATMATWYVDDLRAVVRELTDAGVEFLRYDGLEHDADEIPARAGGGSIAWFCDPDGDTFAIEADT